VTAAHSSTTHVSLRPPHPGQSSPSVLFRTQSDADSFLVESQLQEATSKSKGYALEASQADPESDQSWKLIPLADETILLAVSLFFPQNSL
jgi:hypothetical protein